MPKKRVNKDAVDSEAPKVKGRRGRKPMTPEEKEADAKRRAAEKEKAANMKPELILQYQGEEVNVDALTDAAKAAFHAEKKRTPITELKLYIKPEEQAAYYVINGSYTGKIPF